jgi:hypothetical protein
MSVLRVRPRRSRKPATASVWPFTLSSFASAAAATSRCTTRSGESRTRRPDFTRCETRPSTTCGFVPRTFAASKPFGGSKPAFR